MSEKFEKFLRCVQELKRSKLAARVSQMSDEELQINLTLLGCSGVDGPLAPDELASVRKAVSLNLNSAVG